MPDEGVRPGSTEIGDDIGDVVHAAGNLEFKVVLEAACNDFVPQ